MYFMGLLSFDNIPVALVYLTVYYYRIVKLLKWLRRREQEG
jgi:hypothetical protein